MNPADDPHNHQVSEYKNLPLEYSEEGSCIPKTPYTLSTRDDARTTHTNKEETKIINRVDGEEDKKPRQLIRESTRLELDLELRLGPEPLESSSSSS
ncbi:conserved hypothetical protein [Ricinus communis]|uniref:Uncharacterized protein n=2 Tax=Ricinus communis TaxID=3988 RepID=B9TMF8_RICCO|nr:conserved hypothetical protein [Ricinus communis]